MSSSMFRKKSRANVRHHRTQWLKSASVPQLETCACGERKPRHVGCPRAAGTAGAGPAEIAH